MNLTDLPIEDQRHVLALVEIAGLDYRELAWSELEPLLRRCWDNARHASATSRWETIAPHVRAAREETRTGRPSAGVDRGRRALSQGTRHDSMSRP